MVAVIAVVANHLFDYPLGGFVGVDVFFVISGYLITGRLIRTARTENFRGYIGHFYLLRAKRILPAGVLVALASIVVSQIVFKGARAQDNLVDGLFTLAFTANWRFASSGTDYFAAGGPESVFQQYWSLAVEEQFYIVWPLLLFAACWVTVRLRRRSADSRRAPLVVGAVVAVTVTVGSYLWGAQESVANPTVAYFSTFSRAWELGVGALLACVMPLAPRMRATLATALSWFGTVVIFVALVVTAPGIGFPVPGALLAVLGSAVAIAAGSSGVAPANGLLRNRASVYVGDISYSIYLVHFPAIIFLEVFFDGHPALFYVATLATIASLSLLTFQFVETPFRRTPVGFQNVRGRIDTSLVALLAGAVAIAAFALRPPPQVFDFSVATKADGAAGEATIPLGLADRPLRNGITRALQTESFPEFQPSLSELGADAQNREIWSKCQSNTTIEPSCQFGEEDAAERVLVVGDSVAMSWIPAVSEAVTSRGWMVAGFTRGQCPPALVSMSGEKFGTASVWACDEWHRVLPTVIQEFRPTVVVISGSQNTLDNMAGEPTATAALSTYREGLQQMLSSFGNTRFVYLSSPPQGGSLLECATAGSTPTDCVHSPDNQWFEFEEVNKQVAEKSGVEYIDTRTLFCVQDFCPSFVGQTPVSYDGTHVTRAYGIEIGPRLTDALVR